MELKIMKPKSRQENIVVQDLQGETLIYDLTTDKAFCLNETSAFVWQNCDGEKSVKQIAENLARKNRQPVNEDIVWLAIAQLDKDNLLTDAGSLPDAFAGTSRREMIKKVGLATMIALPLVAGMVAPTAAHAASGGNKGLKATCAANSECASGACVNTSDGANRCCVSATNNLVGNTPQNTGDQQTCNFFAGFQCCSGTGTQTGATTCKCN